MDGAHPPPPPLPSLHQAVQSPPPQVDFLILLFAGTPLKLRPRAKLNAAAAARLSQPGETNDIRTTPIMGCQVGPSVIVNYIYPARLERRHQAFRNIKRRPRTWTSPRRRAQAPRVDA